MHATQLFVYGTLRHDQPEHARFCRGVTAWRPARVRARLWKLAAGYRIATMPAEAILLTATTDAAADERSRATLGHAVLVGAERAAAADDVPWLDGEVLFFRDAVEAWPPLDRWEEFTPGRHPGCYIRAVVPVNCGGETITGWMYLATEAPSGAIPMPTAPST